MPMAGNSNGEEGACLALLDWEFLFLLVSWLLPYFPGSSLVPVEFDLFLSWFRFLGSSVISSILYHNFSFVNFYCHQDLIRVPWMAKNFDPLFLFLLAFSSVFPHLVSSFLGFVHIFHDV